MNNQLDDFGENDEVKSSTIFWDYQKEKTIIGTFMRFESDSFGQHAVINDGKEEIHIPNLTALRTKLEHLKIGQKIKIEYAGEIKSKKSGRLYQDFKVWIKND